MDFYQQLFYHELGTATEKDRYELGKDLPRVAEIRVDVDHKTGRVLAAVQDGDSGRCAHYLKPLDGAWKQFTKFEDGVVQLVFGPAETLYLVSRKDAPRGKVLRLSVKDLDLTKAMVVIAEDKDTLVTNFYDDAGLLPTAHRLYAVYQLGGPSEVRVFDLDGKPLKTPEQLKIGTAGGLTPFEKDDVLFVNGSFVDAVNWYHYKSEGGQTVKTGLNTAGPIDFSDVRVEREFAVSKDGTKVPVNILIPKGAKLDGSSPCLVTGYGGYGINIEPSLAADRRVLFDRGFIVAVANLRGGGEYGEAWHRAGTLTQKQNVFDDFTAVLKLLIDKKYTSSEKLAIRGGSNGGLLMGAMLTQNPTLMKCVIAHVGIYDMLRVELSPNGAFNIPEYGSVKDAAQFKALWAYSPYHNVKDGVKYPATLFLTGANDPRVDPMHSRKMTAKLQSATTATAPILLRTSASSGHGLDTSLSERIEELVDVYGFVFDQLGVKVE
jgi:prolyl oligopeptidase